MTAITYIGHATTLIESDGLAVLTDPVFSGKVLFAKRRTGLNYDPGRLPPLAAVLISHAHHDHLDIESFKYISGKVPVFVPEGLGPFLGKFIRNPVIELRQWAVHRLPNGAEITATYAQHMGFRWTALRYHKCNGYIITANPKSQIPNPKQIFFAGDSGYGPHFKEIGSTYKIDAALLPIASYSPAWFMQKRHLNPNEAIQAFLDTRARHMIPIHHGMFRLSTETLSQPAEWLSRLAGERGLTGEIHILNSGEKFEI